MPRLDIEFFDGWQRHFVALDTLTSYQLKPCSLYQGFTHEFSTEGLQRIEQTALCLSCIQQSDRSSSNHAADGCLTLPSRSI